VFSGACLPTLRQPRAMGGRFFTPIFFCGLGCQIHTGNGATRNGGNTSALTPLV
jgi:hypothetical protein